MPAIRSGATLAFPVVAAAPLLLRRMAQEFDSGGRLELRTTAWMYATYLAHADLYVEAVTRSPDADRSRPSIRRLGYTSALAGVALCLAGLGRFAGASQVSGIEPGPFTTGGVYRVSRNPQYLGYVLALSGVAVARRSGNALALTAAAAAAFWWWVPVEERNLRRRHGTTYARFAASTPRWLGRRRLQPSHASR